MSAVADVVDALMAMLSWLDKPPFGTQMISAGEMTIDYKKSSEWYVPREFIKWFLSDKKF